MIRKKVVFFIESFSGGGAERVLLTVLRNLDMTKFEVTVLVINDCGVYSCDFHELGVRVVSVLSSSSALLNKIKYKLVYNILPPELAVKWVLRSLEAGTFGLFFGGYWTKTVCWVPKGKRQVAWVHIGFGFFPLAIGKGIFRRKPGGIGGF